MLDAVFDQFVEKSPVSVMARGLLERALNPEQLDEWFERTADRQYTEKLLFSSVFALMHDVVCGVYPAVNAAYQVSEIDVSVQALSQKLDTLDITTSAALVRYVADSVTPILQE